LTIDFRFFVSLSCPVLSFPALSCLAVFVLSCLAFFLSLSCLVVSSPVFPSYLVLFSVLFCHGTSSRRVVSICSSVWSRVWSYLVLSFRLFVHLFFCRLSLSLSFSLSLYLSISLSSKGLGGGTPLTLRKKDAVSSLRLPKALVEVRLSHSLSELTAVRVVVVVVVGGGGLGCVSRAW
jgi:hypothetical protein